MPGLPTLEKTYRNAGLHDLALHPDYAKNHFVYFSFNKPGDTVPIAIDTNKIHIFRAASGQVMT